MKKLLSGLTRIALLMLLLVDRTPNFGVIVNATWADLDVEVSSGSGNNVTENSWSLDKSVNTPTLNLPIGANQNVTYTVTATKSTKHNFTFDFSVTVKNDSRWHDANFSLDARILKPNGDPLFNWKNIDNNVYIGTKTSVTSSYSETFEFIGTLPSDILPFKIEVRVIAPGNNRTDKSPANNSLGSSVLNNSLHVVDSFAGVGPWDFTNTGSVNYVRNIESANVGGTHTVDNTVTGDYLGISDSVTVTVNTLNAIPIANSQTLDTDEEVPLNIVLTGSDADASQSISFVDVGTPSNGALSGTSPNLVYTPNADFFGSDSFTFRVFDGYEYSSYATITINVANVNDAPVAAEDSYNTDEDTLLTVAAPGVLGNDTDIDNSSLTAELVSDVSHGLLTFNTDGSFTYMPATNYHGADSFTYKAHDGSAYSNIVTVLITVNSVNEAPVAVDDVKNTDEDVSLVFNATDLLVNDSDIDGDSLTVVSVENAINGTVSLVGGVITFVPAPNYNGLGGFDYTVSDGSLTDTAHVSVSISAVNDAPIAVDDIYNTNEDTYFIINAANGVLSNDTDPEGDALTATLLTNPSHGTLTIFAANGRFRYMPHLNYNGTDSFTYKVTDSNGAVSTATVTINVNPVNDEPIARGDLFSTNEDTVLLFTVEDLLSNDIDFDGDILTITSFSQPGLGSLTLVGNQFTFTPNANMFTLLFPTTFKYTISDGNGGADSAFVSIWINPVNDNPVAVDDAYSVDEDQILNINIANGLLVNDSDVDGPAMLADLDTAPANGTVTIGLLGSFTYTPNTNFNGTDTFTYRVRDGIGGSDIGTVTITVNPINDAPVAVNDVYNTDEDTQLVVSAPGILGNDIDVDGDALTFVLDTNVSNGTLNLNLDGSFTYMPNANYHGVDTFTYHVNDGTVDSGVATVTINVVSVNDLPDADPDSLFMYEDNVLTFTVEDLLDNDSDVDGDTLTITGFTQPGAGTLVLVGNVFTYTPNLNYFGIRSFLYTISDGNGGTDTTRVYITVMPVNDAPVAIDDEYTTNEDQTLVVSTRANGVLGNDYDVDSLIIYADLVTGGEPLNGTVTISLNGRFTYTPNPDFNGVDTFTYRVRDLLGASDTGTVTINVLPVNDEPTAVNDSYSTNEDTLLNVLVPGILGNDIDIDGDPLTIVLDTDVTNGTLNLNTDGSFTYLPNENYFGTDSFTYYVNDGEYDSNTATVTIEVLAVNDAPVAVDDVYITAEDTAITVILPGILGNDTDVEGDPITLTLDSGVTHGILTLNPDGSFTYNPYFNFNGVDSFTYHVNDGEYDSNIATVTINVTPVNDGPIADPSSFTVANAGTNTGTLSGSDPEGAPLSFTLIGAPANGTVVISPTGAYSYTHNGTITATDSFTFAVSDGDLSATATVSITVLPIPAPGNTPPAVINGSGSGEFEEVISGTVLPLGSDADGDPLSFILVSGPTNGTIVFNPDGTFTYTPNDGFDGSDSFTFIANDGEDDSNVGTFTLNVSEEEIIVVEEEETPLVALPFDWFSWLIAALAGIFAWLLAFLRPNMKYTLTDKANNQKVIRRRLSKPDEKTMLVELSSKDMIDIQTIEVEFYKRLAKHCGDVTVNFQLNGKLIHSVIIPANIDDSFETLIRL